MKVITLVGRFGSDDMTGVAKTQHLLSRHLVSKGHANTIYTYSSKCCVEKQDGIVIKKYAPLFKLGYLPVSPAMLEDILREDADLIHVHGYRNPQADFAAIVSYLKHMPMVLTPNGSLLAFRHAPRRILSRLPNYAYDTLSARFVLRQASRIVVASNFEMQDAIKMRIPVSKIALIPLATNAPKFVESERSKVRSKRRRLLIVSRITAIRNFEFLLRSFHRVRARLSDVKLVIIGGELPSIYTGAEKRYADRTLGMCSKLSLGDSIHFLGPIVGDDLWRQYLSCDIFVWSSWYDSFGLAILESALCGRPIVSTPVGMALDLIGKDEGGFVINHGDEESFSRAIMTLLLDDGIYEKASRALISRSEHFSVEAMTSRYERLFKDILGMA